MKTRSRHRAHSTALYDLAFLKSENPKLTQPTYVTTMGDKKVLQVAEDEHDMSCEFRLPSGELFSFDEGPSDSNTYNEGE